MVSQNVAKAAPCIVKHGQFMPKSGSQGWIDARVCVRVSRSCSRVLRVLPDARQGGCVGMLARGGSRGDSRGGTLSDTH